VHRVRWARSQLFVLSCFGVRNAPDEPSVPGVLKRTGKARMWCDGIPLALRNQKKHFPGQHTRPGRNYISIKNINLSWQDYISIKNINLSWYISLYIHQLYIHQLYIHQLYIHQLYIHQLYISINYTLWLFNIAMENGPFIDGLPIKNGDFRYILYIFKSELAWFAPQITQARAGRSGRVDVLAGLGALPPCGEGRQGSWNFQNPWDPGIFLGTLW